MKAEDILNFWFKEIQPSQWWKKDDEFDQLIRDRFMNIYDKARRCELFSWRMTGHGRLAEIIILDQFPRNMFRNSPLAFSSDPQALILAQEAVACGADKQLALVEKNFLYLPFMHSESIEIHEKAAEIYQQPGLESNLEWEIKHSKIIKQFGRYPHRNKALSRQSTKDELAFLKQPGSSF